MMTGIKVLLVTLVSVFSLNIAAQDRFLSRLQGKSSAKDGVVVVHQSQIISDLVNGVVSHSAKTQKSPVGNDKQSADLANSKTNTEKGESKDKAEAMTDNKSEESVENSHQLTKHILKNRVKSTGYRIQVYAGGNSRSSRQEAQRMASLVKSHFPDQPVYTHFYNPRWVCRVGDFRTYEEASAILHQMKALGSFREALIIKGQILISL